MSQARFEEKNARSPVIEKFQEHVLIQFATLTDKDTAASVTNFLIRKLDNISPTTDPAIINKTLADFMSLVDDVTVNLMIKKAKQTKKSIKILLDAELAIFKQRTGYDPGKDYKISDKLDDLYGMLDGLSSIQEYSAAEMQDKADEAVKAFTDSIKKIEIKKSEDKESSLNKLTSVLSLGLGRDEAKELMVGLLSELGAKNDKQEEEFLSEVAEKTIKKVILDKTCPARAANNIATALNKDLSILKPKGINTMWEPDYLSPSNEERAALFAILRTAKPEASQSPNLNNSSTLFGATSKLLTPSIEGTQVVPLQSNSL